MAVDNELLSFVCLFICLFVCLLRRKEGKEKGEERKGKERRGIPVKLVGIECETTRKTSIVVGPCFVQPLNQVSTPKSTSKTKHTTRGVGGVGKLNGPARQETWRGRDDEIPREAKGDPFRRRIPSRPEWRPSLAGSASGARNKSAA